jgi:PEGA domain
MTLARFLSVALVATCTSLAPAFAQEGPKGGGGAGGGGGNGGGGGSVSGVSGGGNNGGATSGSGGGSFGTFGGGGGGGGGGSISSGGSGGSNFDWSSPRGSRSAGSGERRGEMRAAEPTYARAVPPGARSTSGGSRARGGSEVIGQAIARETPLDHSNIERTSPMRLDPYAGLTLTYPYSSFNYRYQCSTWSGYRPCYPNYGFDPWYSGYGYYGLNSMFYDPSWFQDPVGGGPVSVNPSAGLGSLRLKIRPNKGQVFVDGVFVGGVDEFDGTFQKLKLEQGTHRVEVRLIGYEPLVFDVEIRRGQQSLFEGQLRPRQ